MGTWGRVNDWQALVLLELLQSFDIKMVRKIYHNLTGTVLRDDAVHSHRVYVKDIARQRFRPRVDPPGRSTYELW